MHQLWLAASAPSEANASGVVAASQVIPSTSMLLLLLPLLSEAKVYMIEYSGSATAPLACSETY